MDEPHCIVNSTPARYDFPVMSRNDSINISLPSNLRRMVNQKVRTGQYHSPDEVIRESLQLLQQRDQLVGSRRADLRRAIDLGLKQLQRGQSIRLDEHVLEGIKNRGRQRLARLTRP